MEVSATYDSKTIASNGYVLVDNEWCLKEFDKARSDISKASKNMSNPMIHVVMEIEELKDRLKAIKEGFLLLQESTTRMLSWVRKLVLIKVRLIIDGFKQEGVKSLNRLFACVYSIKFDTNTSNNKIAISVHNSYSSLSKNVEKSYEKFCLNMRNTLTYFLAK